MASEMLRVNKCSKLVMPKFNRACARLPRRWKCKEKKLICLELQPELQKGASFLAIAEYPMHEILPMPNPISRDTQ